MEKENQNKLGNGTHLGGIRNFFKEYGYIFGIVVGSILIVSLIVLLSVANAPKSEAQLETNAPQSVFHNPISNPEIIKGYSDTELMYNKTLKRWETHKGIDIFAKSGELVYAIQDGTIKDIYTNNLDGTVIIISHANGLESKYVSLESKTEVKKGDTIKGGAPIGRASNSAGFEKEEGAHLHLELKKNGKHIDPAEYLNISKK